MKANELMVGDFIAYNGTICKVYSIESPFERKDKRFNNKPIITLWCKGFVLALEEEISSIPITKDFLISNDIIPHYESKSYERWGLNDECDCIKICYDDGYDVWYADVVSGGITIHGFPLCYIHELQHLFKICNLLDVADSLKMS